MSGEGNLVRSLGYNFALGVMGAVYDVAHSPAHSPEDQLQKKTKKIVLEIMQKKPGSHIYRIKTSAAENLSRADISCPHTTKILYSAILASKCGCVFDKTATKGEWFSSKHSSLFSGQYGHHDPQIVYREDTREYLDISGEIREEIDEWRKAYKNKKIVLQPAIEIADRLLKISSSIDNLNGEQLKELQKDVSNIKEVMYAVFELFYLTSCPKKEENTNLQWGEDNFFKEKFIEFKPYEGMVRSYRNRALEKIAIKYLIYHLEFE